MPRQLDISCHGSLVARSVEPEDKPARGSSAVRDATSEGGFADPAGSRQRDDGYLVAIGRGE